MKKTAFVSVAAILAVFGLALLFTPSNVSGSGKSTPAGPGTALPDSVQKFVQRACMDCHSTDGNGMARGKVNFSTWADYDAAKQAKKAVKICDELSKQGMPPKKWKANHPNDVPTAAEVDMMCRWAKSLNK